MQSLNNASRRCAQGSAIFSPPRFALPMWVVGREAIVFTTRYVMQQGAKEGHTVGLRPPAYYVLNRLECPLHCDCSTKYIDDWGELTDTGQQFTTRAAGQ